LHVISACVIIVIERSVINIVFTDTARTLTPYKTFEHGEVEKYYTPNATFMCFFSYKSLLGQGSDQQADRKQEVEAGIVMYYYVSTTIAADELIEHDGRYFKRRYAPMKLKKVYKMDLKEVFNVNVLDGGS